MMKKNTVGLVTVFVVAINTTACTRIKSYFPDKEKDYQFRTEIPPLQLPADLQNHAIKDKTSIPDRVYETAETIQVPETEPEVETKPLFTPVELVEFDGGATRLRIEEPMERAWRYVGRALSRQSIEIIDRNEEQFVYVVQYDPDAQKVEDGTLWDEVVFLFGDEPAQEKEFRIRLTEKNSRMTEVIVLDENDVPISKDAGLHLLNLLKNTINSDLAKQ